MVILFNLIVALLILFVIYWFWIKRENLTVTQAKKLFTIKVVDGIYEPAVIKIKANEPRVLTFLRLDKTPCAEVVLFPAINQSLQLPINKPASITVKFDTPGEYEFTCQMGMYRGKLIVA